MAQRRSYSGNAPPTTLTADIDNQASTVTIPVTSVTGYPAGGVAGPFYIVIDRGSATEEKVLIESVSGLNMTAVAAVGRGADDTTRSSHLAGAPVEHVLTAVDLDEANDHVADTTNDDHTQYFNTARHAATSHGTALIADGSITGAKLTSEAWTDYTPTLVQGSTTFTITDHYSKYHRIGRTIIAVGAVTIASGTGQAANALTVSLPVNVTFLPVGVDLPAGRISVFDINSGETALGTAWISSASTIAVGDGIWVTINPVEPFSTTDVRNVGDVIRWHIVYEAAT